MFELLIKEVLFRKSRLCLIDISNIYIDIFKRYLLSADAMLEIRELNGNQDMLKSNIKSLYSY